MFETEALALFRLQAQYCVPYRRYIEALGVDPDRIEALERVPFLPIEVFRTQRVYWGDAEPELVFRSSGTTGADTSHHFVASAEAYERSFLACFEEFYGSPSQYELHTLLPSYREGSSLLYMVEKLKKRCTGRRKLLLGVTFALVEAARSGALADLKPEIVVETGGMKGRGQAIERRELHALLCRAFGVERIRSEYGMCELMSQAYSDGGGVFRTPRSMRVLVRDPMHPLRLLPPGTPGGLNVVDLNNRTSCAFLATGDRGIVHADGSFEVLGRLEGEVLRGCTLL